MQPALGIAYSDHDETAPLLTGLLEAGFGRVICNLINITLAAPRGAPTPVGRAVALRKVMYRRVRP
jgi:hypothetical protein